MTFLLQDVIATLVACGALGLLVRRVAGLVRPLAGEPHCGACPACAVPRGARNDAEPGTAENSRRIPLTPVP